MRAWIVQTLSPLTATVLVVGGILYLGEQAEQALLRQGTVGEDQFQFTIRDEPIPRNVNQAPRPVVSLQQPLPSPLHAKGEARVVGMLLPHHGKVPVTALEFSRSTSAAVEGIAR